MILMQEQKKLLIILLKKKFMALFTLKLKINLRELHHLNTKSTTSASYERKNQPEVYRLCGFIKCQ